MILGKPPINKIILSPLLLLVFLGCISAPKAIPSLDERIRLVEDGLYTSNGSSLLKRMESYGVPGVSIAVINGGKVEWARGYGVREVGGKQNVDASTKFQAASISKSLAAMAALRLVQDGILVLDEDVNKKLVTWKIPDNRYTSKQKVTLRRLLSHSAGTTIHGFQGYAQGQRVPTLVQVLQGAAPANSDPVVVDSTPGRSFRYSGGGYQIVQQLIKDVSPGSFHSFMQGCVLNSLEMDDSSFEQPIATKLLSNVATGHLGNGKPVPGKWLTYPEMAAAGLWTTPSDLARFVIEIQLSLNGESTRVLTAANTQQMLTMQSGDYGLGFDLVGKGKESRFEHGGHNTGFRAKFVGFKEKRQGAVIMANGENGSKVISETMKSIARIYGWYKK